MDIHFDLNDTSEWVAIKEEFFASAKRLAELSSLETSDEEMVYEAVQAYRKAIHSCVHDAIDFGLENPSLREDKRAIVARLFTLSVENDEGWCEALADRLSVSIGDPTSLQGIPDEYPQLASEPVWAPAIEFWTAQRALKLNKGIVNDVLKLRPNSLPELADKVLVAAALGLFELADQFERQSFGKPNGTVDAAIGGIFGVTRQDCLDAVRDPRSYDELVSVYTAQFLEGALPGPVLVRFAMGWAPPMWRRVLYYEAKCLGAAGPHH